MSNRNPNEYQIFEILPLKLGFPVLTKKTDLDIIREWLPNLYSTMDDSSKDKLEELCETIDVEDVITILTIGQNPKKFALSTIERYWEPSDVLGAFPTE